MSTLGDLGHKKLLNETWPNVDSTKRAVICGDLVFRGSRVQCSLISEHYVGK